MAITHEELMEIMRMKQGKLSLRSFSIKVGLSTPYLSDVYRGRRDVGPSLLKALGYRQQKTVTVVYLKCGKGTL